MPDYDTMVRRQKLLADFGDFALRGEDLVEVLTEACRLVGQALGTELAKVVEIQQEERVLLVKAGVGWRPGIVGHERLLMGERSSEAFAIEQAVPVITRNLHDEDRFDFPAFMKEHGVTALVNVPVFLPGGRPYGLIQVDSRLPRDFGPADVEFLRTYATILGPVIDRLHQVHYLAASRDINRQLLAELQHRVKNHFGIITALIGMRHREARGEETRRELAAIGRRIDALRLVHEQLYVGGRTDHLPLRPYVTQLVESLCGAEADASGAVTLDLAIGDVHLPPDLAVPLGLILNEFVTNSLKYAFGADEGGTITIGIDSLPQGRVRVRMSDNGRGLPPGPLASSPGLSTGMSIIAGLSRQIRADAVWSSSKGTTLCLEFLSSQS